MHEIAMFMQVTQGNGPSLRRMYRYSIYIYKYVDVYKEQEIYSSNKTNGIIITPLLNKNLEIFCHETRTYPAF